MAAGTAAIRFIALCSTKALQRQFAKHRAADGVTSDWNPAAGGDACGTGIFQCLEIYDAIAFPKEPQPGWNEKAWGRHEWHYVKLFSMAVQ